MPRRVRASLVPRARSDAPTAAPQLASPAAAVHTFVPLAPVLTYPLKHLQMASLRRGPGVIAFHEHPF